jgi:hypothetical protein
VLDCPNVAEPAEDVGFTKEKLVPWPNNGCTEFAVEDAAGLEDTGVVAKVLGLSSSALAVAVGVTDFAPNPKPLNRAVGCADDDVAF